jgi:hypothetical protein
MDSSNLIWVGDKETKHLTIGHIFKLGNNVVTWCYKKQPIMFFSSIEASIRCFLRNQGKNLVTKSFSKI